MDNKEDTTNDSYTDNPVIYTFTLTFRDTSMPSKKSSIVSQQRKSDILSLLQSIDNMFVACQHVLNSYTQTTLLLSIALEAQMLLMKLQVMKDRWSVHLPFKEACMVDFLDWSKKVKEMSQKLGAFDNDEEAGGPFLEFCPSKHFMLDLMALSLENASMDGSEVYYRETDITRFLANEEKLRKQISRSWDSYRSKLSHKVAEKVDQRIGRVLEPIGQQAGSIRAMCAEVLHLLSEELNQLYEQIYRKIPSDMFERLAERVCDELEYGGRKAKLSAHHDVEDIKNKTPDQDWARRRDEEISVSIEIIGEMKYGSRILDHLGEKCDIRNNLHKLGKCLYGIRKDIGKQELSDLIEHLYRICYLREDKEREEAMAVEQSDLDAIPNAKDARAVYEKRRAVQPCRPHLPLFFKSCLLDNEAATCKFYDVLHHCGFYVGRALLDCEKRDSDIRIYENWKWKHFREAFINLGFIKSDSTKKGFAEFLASVFPYLSAENVQRGFSSRGGYEDKEAYHRIVKEIEYEFQSVKELCGKEAKR